VFAFLDNCTFRTHHHVRYNRLTRYQQVELGGYVGYSAILFANALRKAGGETFVCLERNPEFAAVVSSLVNLAGLSSVVRVEVGSAGESICRLHDTSDLKTIDLLFLDHYKPAYLPDLKLCEELGLIKQGSVLAADNVVKPGNPPYLEYVRSSVEDKKKRAKVLDGGKVDVSETFESTYSRQYEKREGKEELDAGGRGNPALVYVSELVKSYEPTGVPVSEISMMNAIDQGAWVYGTGTY
jgi:catechol O-methyltransferase